MTEERDRLIDRIAARDNGRLAAIEERDHYLDRIGKYAGLVARIQSALGTAASGDALVEVAAQARRDQRVLAAVEAELQDNHDVGWEGEPNACMQLTTFIAEHKEGRYK